MLPNMASRIAMDNSDRLEKMLEGTNFMCFPDLKSENPMKDLEDHNQKQWKKLDDKRSEKIRSLIWAVAADELQQLALDKFGNTSDLAVRGVLGEILNDKLLELESKPEWQEFVKDAQDCFVSEEGMTPSKAEQCIKFCFIDSNVDIFADNIKQWEMLPRSTAPETVDILTQMFKEVACVDG